MNTKIKFHTQLNVMKRIIPILLLTLALPFCVFAQNTYNISGKVVSKSDNSTLPGANVILEGTTYGNATNINGKFTVSDVPAGKYKLKISYVGYTSKVISINLDHNINVGTVALSNYEFSKEVIVSAKRAEFRKTPVAFASIDKQQIQEVAAASGEDVSMATADIPNVYATGGSGGIGDSRLTIRGFNDNYVGLLINGVPVNDMENGHVYWSDFSGLSQVANNIQVTMGMGDNPLSTEAVGGTVNLTTSSLKAKRGGNITYRTGDWNMQQVGVQYSTGLLNAKNGGKYGVTALINRHTQKSDFKSSKFQGFTFFLTFGYTKGNNTLNFTAFGSPQKHGQRTSAQTVSTWDTYGMNYNPNLGYLGSGNSEQYINSRVNYYFKPVFSLDDTYKISDKSMVTATLYYSWGTGWGSGPLSVYGYRIPSNPVNGLLNFNTVFNDNQNNAVTVYNAAGQLINGDASKGILRLSHNDHQWAGLIANYKHNFTKALTLNLSFDGRYYVGAHYRTVSNLLGGNFWVENTNPNLNYDNSGYGGTGNIAYYPGDKIAYYNKDFVKKYGLNAQLEYTNSKASAFINGSVSNTGYAREDYFELGVPKTKYYNFRGYIVKGGVNYNLTDWLNVFANGGYNSKAPYFSGVFRYTNTPIENRRNEAVSSFELGLGLKPNSRSSISMDYYYTRWGNQTFNVSAPTAPGANDNNFYNVNGLNEIHKGFELRGKYTFSRNLYFKGGLAFGDNYYENNVSSAIFNNNHQKVGTSDLYIKGLKVSGAPQTTGSLGFRYRFDVGQNNGKFFIMPMARYYANYYAAFNPTYRTKPGDQSAQAYRISPYSIIDVTSGYQFPIKGKFAGLQSAEVLLSLTNVMNADYITNAYDNNGTYQAMDVFFGRPRTATVSFKVNF